MACASFVVARPVNVFVWDRVTVRVVELGMAVIRKISLSILMRPRRPLLGVYW